MTPTRRVATAALGVVVALCCAFATYVVHRFFVGTEVGQTVDQALLEKAAALPVAVAQAAESVLSLFTIPFVLAVCAVPPLVAVLRRSPWHAVAALVLVGGANITTQVLKDHVFERPDLLALGAPNSLPSGHTTVVASVMLGLVLIVPSAWRRPAAVVGLAATLLVGLATIVAGWHRLSDVAAALLVSLAWAGLVLVVMALRPATSPVTMPVADSEAPTARLPVRR
ncbi:MAG: phosphatase PAP2 family protein [Nocardioidaceae bacterium]